MTNITTNQQLKRQKQFIGILATIALILFIINVMPKKNPQIPASNQNAISPTPLPTITLDQKQNVVNNLPYVGDTYIIQYLSKIDSFTISVTEPPIEEGYQKAIQWLTDHGVSENNAKIINLSAASRPKTSPLIK